MDVNKENEGRMNSLERVGGNTKDYNSSRIILWLRKITKGKMRPQ